ncbi:MAG TPA: glutathione peroxidase [Terriglobia bacterium]|nr:glutathione peroxidase [Terriglobia bacterium]
MSVYDFQARGIDGSDVSISQYRGNVLLIVNVASKCGFTPQYTGLESLYEKYRDQGFAVLGFPCNQFGSQEPGTESDIKSFCDLQYGVTFPLFSKIDVNGPNTHPLYTYLKTAKPGILGTEGIKWNFTKFLIDRNGEPIKRYAPADKPEAIDADVESALRPAT